MLKIVLKWFSKLRETSKFLLTNLQYKCCVMSAESVDSQQHAWAHATKWDGFVLPWHFTSCLKFCSYAELRHVIFRHSASTWHLQCKFYINKSSPHLNFLLLTELTEMSWYEWFIIAIRRLRSTMMLMTEKLPNMTRPQNLVNSLIPASSKLSKSMRPNDAQNSVCVVSHKLQTRQIRIGLLIQWFFTWQIS